MNKDRRDRLRHVASILENARDEISSIREDEDEARENMPENLTGSEAFEKSEQCSDLMDDAMCSIDDAVSSIQGAI